MPLAASLHRSLSELGARGLLTDARPLDVRGPLWLKGRDLVAAAQGTLALRDRAAAVQVGLTAGFPFRLPLVAVDPQGPLGRLPHVEPDGAVCYRPQDEPLLDRRDPVGIVSEAICLAAETLNAMLHGDRAAEYTNEIVAYWGTSFPKSLRVEAVLEPGDEPRIVTASHGGVRITVADDSAVFASFRSARSAAGLSIANAIYAPIDPAAADPNFHPRDLATPDGVRAFVLPVLRQDKDHWRRMLRRCDGREVILALGVRRPLGRRALVGLLLKRGPRVHALDPDSLEAHQILPVRIDPADRRYLVPRGGADLDLTQRRVLVIGCGAVGGHVAFNLVKAGVGDLHLMDGDSFEYANTFRHVCGRAHLGAPKVEGLRLEIERLWPFVSVTCHPVDVLDWLRDHPAGFRAYDLVISAIGNPTVEALINERIHAAEMPPAVFAWLEPLGIGGHILTTHVGAARGGCFECLYGRQAPDGPLACRAAFAAPGARYTRDVMGCGGEHMPFGDLDAQRTAAYVARRALDLLRGRLTRGELLSWKGPAEAFVAEGFRTTPRYDLCAPEETVQGDALARSDCPVCQTA